MANLVPKNKPFQLRNFTFNTKAKLPGFVRWFSVLLILAFIALPIVLAFVPWQQTVQGRGQLIAYVPSERKQVVTALISGQVKKWYVVEGTKVKEGDPIVDIEDNDPELASRLDNQKKFLTGRRKAADEEVNEQQKVVEAQEKVQDSAIRAAKAARDAVSKSVEIAKKSKVNIELAVDIEKIRFEMTDKLFDKGLDPKLLREENRIRYERAKVEVDRAENEIERTKATLLNNDSLVYQAEANGLNAIAVARRDLRKAEQNLFSIDRDIEEINNRIERFKARFIKAPCSGTIYRVSANAGQGGQLVKEGEELVEIVPDTADRVVELMIDGVDAPLIAAHMEKEGRGSHVRLQFEGWPGLQFAGWPSVAVGTFGGKVRQIDPTDDGNGKFRIIIEPEEMFEGDQWPDGLFLRQGNQAVGWVFLNRVTLGYELWRQFNGFPPVVAPKAPDKKDKDKKAPKVKPG